MCGLLAVIFVLTGREGLCSGVCIHVHISKHAMTYGKTCTHIYMCYTEMFVFPAKNSAQCTDVRSELHSCVLQPTLLLTTVPSCWCVGVLVCRCVCVSVCLSLFVSRCPMMLCFLDFLERVISTLTRCVTV